MKVILDKIASSTRNANISSEVQLGPVVPAEEGAVIAVRVQGTKTVYNTVENINGRMVRIDDGDLLAGVLGSRRAIRGYAGVIPQKIEVGERLHILNLGGVIGKCTSVNLELGPPLEAEVLGAVLSFPYLGERTAVPANIRDGAIAWSDRLEPSAPIIYVAGTCMSAGKTFACGEIIRYLTKKGARVCGAKLTGVSLLRDTLSMQDRGAIKCLTFTDAGVVTTRKEVSVPVAKGIINALNQEKPDCIVVELGDGVLGEYGVQEALLDEDLMQPAVGHVVCATDNVAAWGAAELYKNLFKREMLVFSGPATDNDVGKDYIEKHLNTPARNARLDPKGLGEIIEGALQKKGFSL